MATPEDGGRSPHHPARHPMGVLMSRGIAIAVLALTAAVTIPPAAAQSYGPCQRNTGGVQMAGPFTVLFDLGSARLRPSEMKTINEVVQRAKDRQVAQICLIGRADKIGDAKANERLSKARAEAVAAEMKRQGIAGARFLIDPKGEVLPGADLGRMDASAKDRSVTIVFAR
jgi:outer membrane protein OmpA-like peptidoglycan-associated protein